MSRATQKAVITERIQLVNQLEKELQRIRKAQSELGYLELPKPLRDGWYKTFRLRDDILRSKNAKTYKEVLKAVLVEIWGSEKKYADKRWKKHFSQYHEHFQRPGIKRLNEKEFEKLSCRAKKCFVKRRRMGCKGYRNSYACTIPKYYFVIAYRRAYMTKRKIVSPILESREQEIMEILYRPTLFPYSLNYKYNYRLYYKPNKRERRRVKMELSNMKIDAKQAYSDSIYNTNW